MRSRVILKVSDKLLSSVTKTFFVLKEYKITGILYSNIQVTIKLETNYFTVV